MIPPFRLSDAELWKRIGAQNVEYSVNDDLAELLRRHNRRMNRLVLVTAVAAALASVISAIAALRASGGC